ncbi:hypothetical protein GGQ92_002852 [Gracilibacillus halotolerans]|uniref:Uncharacterized protein n=1 Tax=Gracilibacillus halotolerans TaxID=74386 RepID=A0A841RMK6_9BACI|nr:hypothetical protein [Gracilibacillus halotolerans]MBB6514031.1 hypothetical protein [Gracilibacillus halotolerans]
MNKGKRRAFLTMMQSAYEKEQKEATLDEIMTDMKNTLHLIYKDTKKGS